MSKPEENIKALYFGMHLSKGPLLKLSPQGGPSQTIEQCSFQDLRSKLFCQLTTNCMEQIVAKATP